MIYVTGDTHGDLNFFKMKEIKRLTKNDYLIICGDFGYIWDGSDSEKKFLQWIGKRKFTTLFIDGTHENFPLLNSYPIEEFCGGKVNHISGNLYHLMRGEIFTIEGKTFFTFGGGNSSDKDYRTNENCWWEEELPSYDECMNGVANLKAVDNKVDYIITHQPLTRITYSCEFSQLIIPSSLDVFLDELSKNVIFEKWFFGCTHIDKIISNKYYSLFKSIFTIK